MRDSYKILLLVTFTLLLFLPSVQSGYFVVDDLSLVSAVQKTSHQPLKNYFQPVNGTYYRPLMGLSYTLDARLGDLQPAFMHLENILIHALNVVLVFLLTRCMLSRKSGGLQYLPLLAAALFLVHPANTESINWISGRSDPLATLFSLLGAYFFLLALQYLKQWPFWMASAMILAGGLTKEVALFIYPGCILILLLIKPAREGLMPTEPGKPWRLLACLPFVAGGLLYGYLRSAAYTTADLGAEMILESTVSQASLWFKFETMLAAFGFYLKKLVVPFPLSFAIGGIDPVYFWVGLFSGLLLLIPLLRRDRIAAILLLMLLPLIPALVVPVVKFAFMPAYAERYLYLSTAFLAIGLAVLLFEKCRSEKSAALLLLFLVIAYLPGSIQRNLMWTDHVRLLETADVQALEFPGFWHAYCVALANDEQFDRARSEFGKLLARHPEDQPAYINLAKMELYINDPEAARQAMAPLFAGRIEPNEASLNVMVELNRARLATNHSIENQQTIHGELIRSLLKLFDLRKKPEHLLAAAESALVIGAHDVSAELVNRISLLNDSDAAVINDTQNILSELNGIKN